MNTEALTPRLLSQLSYPELSDLQERNKKTIKKLNECLIHGCSFTDLARAKVETMKAVFEIDKTFINQEIENRCMMIPNHAIYKMLA